MQTNEVGRPPKVSLSSESWETLLSEGFSIWFIDTKISIFLLGKFPPLRFHGHRIGVFLSGFFINDFARMKILTSHSTNVDLRFCRGSTRKPLFCWTSGCLSTTSFSDNNALHSELSVISKEAANQTRKYVDS